MILNLQQQTAIANGEPVALNVAGTECVLVRKDVYLRLDPDYNTGPWTTEEMNLLADEADEMISQRESHVSYYRPWWFLRAMFLIAWCAFRHPFSTSVIELPTGRIIRNCEGT